MGKWEGLERRWYHCSVLIFVCSGQINSEEGDSGWKRSRSDVAVHKAGRNSVFYKMDQVGEVAYHAVLAASQVLAAASHVWRAALVPGRVIGRRMTVVDSRLPSSATNVTSMGGRTGSAPTHEQVMAAAYHPE
jgi:hypothetical protein